MEKCLIHQRVAPSAREVLDSAANAIKRGDIALGKEGLLQVLHEEPDNVLAWLWMSRCVQGTDAKLKCFHRVLANDPVNEHALNGIRSLSRTGPRPEAGLSAQKQDVPPSTAGPNQSAARRRRAPLLFLFGVIASIAFCICGFSIIAGTSDASTAVSGSDASGSTSDPLRSYANDNGFYWNGEAWQKAFPGFSIFVSTDDDHYYVGTVYNNDASDTVVTLAANQMGEALDAVLGDPTMAYVVWDSALQDLAVFANDPDLQETYLHDYMGRSYFIDLAIELQDGTTSIIFGFDK